MCTLESMKYSTIFIGIHSIEELLDKELCKTVNKVIVRLNIRKLIVNISAKKYYSNSVIVSKNYMQSQGLRGKDSSGKKTN